MDNNEIESDYELEVATEEQAKENIMAAIEEEKITAFLLASMTMDQFKPSFVLIGSPHLKVSDNGYTYPLEIGVAINENLNITRSVLSSILFNVADELGSEIIKVSNFLSEALNEEEEDE